MIVVISLLLLALPPIIFLPTKKYVDGLPAHLPLLSIAFLLGLIIGVSVPLIQGLAKDFALGPFEKNTLITGWMCYLYGWIATLHKKHI